MAEVKTYQAFLRGSGNPSSGPAPNGPADVLAYGGTLKETGHTEWVDGKVHETGFTAAFPPNTRVEYTSGGKTYDVDFISSTENANPQAPPTYAAVTAELARERGERPADGRLGPVRPQHSIADHIGGEHPGRRRGGRVGLLGRFPIP